MALRCKLLHVKVEMHSNLLKNGANVSVMGGKYGNALQAALSNGKQGDAKLLLEYGAMGCKYIEEQSSSDYITTESDTESLGPEPV